MISSAGLKKPLKIISNNPSATFFTVAGARFDPTTSPRLYVDFPKEEEAGDPASYRQCLRSAVSLAHQIAVRWALSKYCTKNRFLSIGIAAGEYAIWIIICFLF